MLVLLVVLLPQLVVLLSKLVLVVLLSSLVLHVLLPLWLVEVPQVPAVHVYVELALLAPGDSQWWDEWSLDPGPPWWQVAVLLRNINVYKKLGTVTRSHSVHKWIVQWLPCKAHSWNTTTVLTSAAFRSIGSTTGCTITEKAPTRAFSWLKAATSAFTFKTLLRHYAKLALTPRSFDVKLGPQRNQEKVLVGAFAVIMNLRMDLFEALERNDGGSLHASIIHHWTRKILCSSGENGEECFQCLLWSNNDSCDSRWKIDNGGMTPGKWSCHVCID